MKFDAKFSRVPEQPIKKQRSLSILLADNNPGDVTLFRNLVASLESDPRHHLCIALTCVDSASAVQACLSGARMCDMLLFDLNLLDNCHEKTVEYMKAYAEKIPAIVLAGTHYEAIAIRALKSGFQDYLVKGELNVHRFYRVAHYAIERFKILRERNNLIASLQKAIDETNTLRGLLPICTHCKKIRDDKGYWAQLEVYISAHSHTLFTHGICPKCAQQALDKMRSDIMRQ